MLAKKIRTEYMKKFREPKWETFSKCYEDCVRYRLTRRVLEHAHRPWLWEGWDSGSDSSGRSTPTTRNKVSPLAVTSPTLYHSKNERSSPEPKHICGIREIRRPSESGEAERDLRHASPPPEPVIENGPMESDEGPLDRARVNTGPSDETHTDEDGPANQASSPGDDEERARTRAKHHRRRRRHRAPRSEPGHGDVPLTPPSRAKSQPPSRAKSQPPAGARSSRPPPPGRSDGTERRVEAPTRTPPEKREPLPFHRTPVTSSSSSSLHTQGHALRAGAPTRRESDKPGGSTAGRRRARSADLEKTRRSELAVAPDDRWVTEYMRCFSARLR